LVLSEHEERRTLEVFQFIRLHLEGRNFSPSLKEIANGCEMSTANLYGYLGRLEGWEWIIRDYKIPRSIRLGKEAPSKEAFEKLWEEKKPKEGD
jgi:SOS-response transcriptional repressor LexA